MTETAYIIILYIHLIFQPLWKLVLQFLKQLNMYVPYDPAILCLGNFQKENESICLNKGIYMNAHGSLI